MPRYHFHIAGLKVFDSLGAVLPDTEAALMHAIDLAANVGKHTLEPEVDGVRLAMNKDVFCSEYQYAVPRSPHPDDFTGASP